MAKSRVHPSTDGPEKYALYNAFESLDAYFTEVAEGPAGGAFAAAIAKDCTTLRALHANVAALLRERRWISRDKRDFQNRLRQGSLLGVDETQFLQNEFANLTDFHTQTNAKIRRSRRYLASLPIRDPAVLEEFERHVRSIDTERCQRERERARSTRLTEQSACAPTPTARERSAPPIAATLLGDGASLPQGFFASATPSIVFVRKGALPKTAWQRLAELHRPGILFRFLDSDGAQYDDAIVSTPPDRCDDRFVLVDTVSRGNNARLLSTLQSYTRAPRLRKVA